MIRGSVDLVTSTEVHGWAFAPGRHEPVLVQVVLNHEILGESVANINRPDLAAAGMGSGHSGFNVQLFRPIDTLYLPFLMVKVDGGDAELPRAAMLGFSEFFSALFLANMSAGRHRSVLGGLWTDRIDAMAVLRGKLAIGAVSAEPALSQLIQSGFAVVGLLDTPDRGAWREALAPQAAEMLEDPALLPLLRGALEDNPLAVRADWLRDGESELGQPSAGNPSPFAAECLAVVVAFDNSVVLDVVRNSHMLPEFTTAGVSRWISGSASNGVSLAAAGGMLDRVELEAGQVAVIGPGTLYRVKADEEDSAVLLLCLPQRGSPMALATGRGRRESARKSGVRVSV